MNTADTQWRQRAQSLTLPQQFLVGDRHCAAHSGRTFEIVSPMTGRVFTSLPAADAIDVDRAVAVARKTFESGVWSGMPPTERKKKLVRLAGLIERHRDELALMDTLCMGMPISIASNY